MCTILIVPVLVVIINGRNIQDLESLDPGNLTSFTEWLLRLATMGIVGLSALLLAERGLRGDRRPLDRGQLELLVGFLALYVGTTIVPGIFGSNPSLPRNFFYVLLVFLAVFARRHDGAGPLIDALKWTILSILLISFVFAAVDPNAALRYYAPELRLPFIPFRFWGVGSSANSTGPLALVLALLVIAKPFAARWLNRLAFTAAAIVILLAQSQTTWIAGVLIVPAMILYGRALDRGRVFRLRIPTGLAIFALSLAGMALIAGTAAWLSGPPRLVEPTPGLTGYGEALTGRGNIWRIAIKVFLDNPLFGYGPNAWTVEFRQAVQMPYATSAHNQLLQSLSMGGLCGLAGLMLYVVALVRWSFQRAAPSRGLAPALLGMTLLRSFSEAPLELGTLLYADMVMQLLLFALLLDRNWTAHAKPQPVPMPEHRRRPRSPRPSQVRHRDLPDLVRRLSRVR